MKMLHFITLYESSLICRYTHQVRNKMIMTAEFSATLVWQIWIWKTEICYCQEVVLFWWYSLKIRIYLFSFWSAAQTVSLRQLSCGSQQCPSRILTRVSISYSSIMNSSYVQLSSSGSSWICSRALNPFWRLKIADDVWYDKNIIL